MEWLVCKYKFNGQLFVMSRTKREELLAKLTVLEMDIPSVVVRTFDNYDEALIFVSEQTIAQYLIDKAFSA